MRNENEVLDAPIPGQSLCAPPGGSKMEQPPQFVDVSEALEYMWDKLTRPNSVLQLEVMLKKEMPVDYLTRTIMWQLVSEGVVNVDVAVQMANIVYNMIISIAKLKKIKYVAKEPDRRMEQFLKDNIDILDIEDTFEEKKAAPRSIFGIGE